MKKFLIATIFTAMTVAGAMANDIPGPVNTEDLQIGSFPDHPHFVEGKTPHIPEPVSLVLLGSGLIGLVMLRNRRRA